MASFLTACPRNCYSSCSFKVEIDGNRITSLSPFTSNQATPEGPCIKGLAYLERASSEERITRPLRRRDDGSFEPIEMTLALKIIADRLKLYKNESGPDSILFYKGSGMSGLTNELSSHFWSMFGGATTTYGNLCWPAGLEAVRLTMGSVKHNVPWDMANAEVIIFWGKNPAETNIQEIIHAAEAASRGAKIIVIDPRRTPTVDKSHQWYMIKPGTDGALALGIAKYLIDNDMTDTGFIDKYVNDFSRFSKGLGIDINEAESITGIPGEKIIELANLIASSKKVVISPGYGLQRYSNGGETIRSILALSVLTGNIGSEGCGFNFANLQSYIFDTTLEPLSYYPDKKSDYPFRRALSMAKLGEDMISLSDPPLRMAWVERGNPLTQSPDTTNVRKAFEKLDFVVVAEQFMTDTAAVADIILPAKNMFEQTDVIGSYWSPYIQLKPKLLEPPDDVMPESEIYYHLSEMLALKPAREESSIPPPGDENIVAWLEKRMKPFSNITIDDLRKGPIIPSQLEPIAWADKVFHTPSGKIELCPSDLVARWNVSDMPSYTPLRVPEADKDLPIIFCSPNIGSRIHSQFGNLKSVSKVVDPPSIHISLHDAKLRGINSGDKVVVSNSRGSFRTIAKVSSSLQKGVAHFPNGIWSAEGGSSNCVTYPLETDIGHGAAFHNARVEIRRGVAL